MKSTMRRVSPPEDVTLEITAPQKTWEVITNLLGRSSGDYDLYVALNSEFSDRDRNNFGGGAAQKALGN